MSLSVIDSREWNKFFPAEIQTLTAKRRIFTKDHFSSKKLGPVIVPLFTRPPSPVEQKRFDATVFSWIQGVAQSLSHGYLKLATFLVISKLDNSILEMYEYYFAYNNGESDTNNESFSSTTSTDDIQQQVLKALEQIDKFIDERISPIVDRSNYRVCLKIEYNSSVTPGDYQPTGFFDSQTIISPINWKKVLTTKASSSRRILAQIKTAHHKMLLVFRTPTSISIMKK